MKGLIYKVTNKVTGKSYIGQTRYSLEFRWRQHLHKKDNTYFHNAIRKYGPDNFSREVLEECDVSELNSREIYYIAKYDTFRNGYNLTKGGEGNSTLLLDNCYSEIKELYLAGFSSNKIAGLYNVDKASIVKILKGLGVKIRSNKLNFNNQEFNELVEDYKSGFSFKELAKRYDCTGGALKEMFIRKGIDVRIKYNILNDEQAQDSLIREYSERAVKLTELLSKYRCSYATFSKVLSIHGVKRLGRGTIFKLSDKECLDVIDLFNRGEKVSRISKKFNVDKCTIYSILKRYHVNYLKV